MTASVALDPLGSHVPLAGVGVLERGHASELPWVLTSVQEEDVVSCDVETLVEAVDLPDLLLDVSGGLLVDWAPGEQFVLKWCLGVRDKILAGGGGLIPEQGLSTAHLGCALPKWGI